MKKILFLLLFLISITANAETYYVKNGGSDVAAGTSDATAWATVAKVNATSFNPGDSVLFRCNDYWREYISFSPPAGTAGGRVYYGSYQTGNKPLFLGSKEENLQTDWTNISGNIWKNTDAQFNVGYGVGNLIFNNETSTGYKEADSTNLNAQGDWFWNDVTKQVYLYSTINPALYYTDIECALDRVIISLAARDYITLDGLDIRYGGQHGISGSTGNDNITIRNCHVSYMGGSEFPDATARYGNGIQFWKGATNIIIEKNVIEQIYDDGITPQYDGADGVYSVSMDIRYNVINNTRISINIFERAVSSTIAINIYNNTMMNAGLEWSSDGQRPDPTFGARHIRLAGITGTISSFNIKNNIFYEADMTCFYGYGSTPLASFDIDNNLYFNSIGTIAQIEDTPYTTLAAWQTGSSQEANSVAGNPLFSSSTNFYLQATSPARNTGTDVSLTSDIAGITVPQETYPEMGAYEYINLPIPVTGLGWEDHLAKRNFKDDINFAGRWMIDGIPVTATASELNALVGQGQIISGIDTLYLSNRINAKADTSLSNLGVTAINADLLPATSGSANLGSALLPFGDIYLNGSISTASTIASSGLVSTGAIRVGTSDTGSNIDSVKVSGTTVGAWDGATQLSWDFPAADEGELGTYAYLLGDTLYSQNPAVYTQRQVDSLLAGFTGGWDSIYIYARVDSLVNVVNEQQSQIDLLWAAIDSLGLGDFNPPAFLSAEIGSFSDSILVVIMNAGDVQQDSIPVVGAFTVKENGSTFGIEAIDIGHDSVYIALDSTAVLAKTYTVSYNKNYDYPQLQDSSKNITPSWTNKPVTNNFYPLHADYQTLYDAMTNPPTGDTIKRQNAIIYSLDSLPNNVWDRVKILYVYANGRRANSLINWRSPGTLNSTDPGGGASPPFTAYQGFNGQTDNYLGTGWNCTDSTLTLAGTYVGTNSITIASWQLANLNGAYFTLGSASGGGVYTTLMPNSTTIQGGLNSAIVSATGDPGSTVGMTMLTRRGKTEVEGYFNGESKGTDNDASTTPSNTEVYTLARNNNGAVSYPFNGNVSIILVMNAVTDGEATAIYNIFKRYIDWITP